MAFKATFTPHLKKLTASLGVQEGKIIFFLVFYKEGVRSNVKGIVDPEN